MAIDPTQQMEDKELPDPPWRAAGDLSGAAVDGDYLIERLLGQGGCGCVYLAKDLPLDRHVAIKTLGAGQSPAFSSEGVQRFMREARAIASVEHANIVPVHRVGKDGDLSYIVMQYVKGQDLAERMEEEVQMSVADALMITHQIASALEAAHSIGLVHRDIKPSNVMIDDQGRVKVMDFGLARTDDPDTAITSPGMFVGTPRYSSPEQCSTTSIDCRSDLYSLGVILYEMLAGDVPHEAETPIALMQKIMIEPPPPIREHNPKVPKGVEEIVERLLAKDPEDRYGSAAELKTDLHEAIQRLKESSSEAFEPTIHLATEHGARQIHRQTTSSAWAVAAGILITGVLVGMFFVSRNWRQTTGRNPVPGPAAPNANIVMALYDFDNVTKDSELDWLKLGIPDMLAANLSQLENFKIKTRDEVLWTIDPPPTVYDDSLRPQLIGLGVKVVVKGSIYREKDKVRFVVHLISLDGNKKIGIVRQKGTVDEVFTAVDSLAAQIVEILAGKPTLTIAAKRKQCALNTQQLFARNFQVAAAAPPAMPRKAEQKPHSVLGEKREEATVKALADEKLARRGQKLARNGTAKKSDNSPTIETEILSGTPVTKGSIATFKEISRSANNVDKKMEKLNLVAQDASKDSSAGRRREVDAKIQIPVDLDVSMHGPEGAVRKKSLAWTAKSVVIAPRYFYKGKQFLCRQMFSKAIHHKHLSELIQQLSRAKDLREGAVIFQAWKEKIEPPKRK